MNTSSRETFENIFSFNQINIDDNKIKRNVKAENLKGFYSFLI